MVDEANDARRAKAEGQTNRGNQYKKSEKVEVVAQSGQPPAKKENNDARRGKAENGQVGRASKKNESLVVAQSGQPPSKKEANDARRARAEGNQNASKDKKTVVAQSEQPLNTTHKSRKI